MKKKLIALTIALAALVTHSVMGGPSDEQLRNSVFQIISPVGSCTAEQVIAPSGKAYALSAAHCMGLMSDRGTFLLQTEDGRQFESRMIAEDTKSDLVLMEGAPNVPGLEIARSVSRHDEVRSFTHGSRMKTYQTKGQIIDEIQVDVVLNIVDPANEAGCPKMEKIQELEIPIMFGLSAKACVLLVKETVTTAKIVPGSSGGPIVDAKGRLVGVASAVDGQGFGFLVRLSDIQSFLRAY